MTAKTSLTPTRRNFLKGIAATGAALTIGFTPEGLLAAGPADAILNPFVRVASDGTVTVILKHFEMGQGTTTGLTTLIAEEMDVDWDKIEFEFAPSDNKKYKNLAFGAQGTGGSSAIANSFMQYRMAGAAAKELIVRAAATAWGVNTTEIIVENSQLTAGDKTAHFGEFVAAAAKLKTTGEPTLKDPKDFRLIGKESLPRKDNSDKTDGTAMFGMDVKVPNMVYAVILRSPRFGGKLKSFDVTKAKEVKGFFKVKELGDGKGLAVYAASTWSAISARKAIETKWDFASAENRSSSQMAEDHLEALKKEPQFHIHKDMTSEKTTKIIEAADKKLEAEFLLPLLAHAPMEPLNCVIEPKDDGSIVLHDGCQFPALVHPTISKILGLPLEKVSIKTVYAGGSFGRRANGTSDYAAEAAEAYKLLGNKKAVKLIWTREDDLAGGYYRPMAAHGIKIGVNEDGTLKGWNHHIVTQSIVKGTPFAANMIKDGVDDTSVEGVADTDYTLPNMAVGLTNWHSPMKVLWWRSVGHSHSAYAMEVAMDMAAKAAGSDPLAFRLAHLNSGTKDQARLAAVLKLAAEKSGWSETPAEGRARGIAAHKSFGSYVAEVVEISDNNGEIKIERVTCAVDCGIPVNPDVIRAQMEGGIGYGIGHIMRDQITLDEGKVEQANFPDYEPLRIGDIGAIDVHIIPSTEPPTGVGEPGVPPAGPALANAIFALRGKPVLKLPMTENGVEFV
ncbi:MAG: dehydrogenase [Rhodomicrobium sp.]|nr:MAG: dehydrogenase [Rhodomicrobium sp.]